MMELYQFGIIFNALRNLFIALTATIISIIVLSALVIYFGYPLFSGVWFLVMAGYLVGDIDGFICRRLTNNYGEGGIS